jgi:hypothetical protein
VDERLNEERVGSSIRVPSKILQST